MLQLLVTLLWVYGVASWCMCFYVLFSCGEGLRWFATLNNYLLILGAVGAAAAAPVHRVPSASLLLVFTGWSFYAMLVTAHQWRFRLWARHIIPVNLPLLFILLWEAARQPL